MCTNINTSLWFRLCKFNSLPYILHDVHNNIKNYGQQQNQLKYNQQAVVPICESSLVFSKG